jgi:hypothetical protein
MARPLKPRAPKYESMNESDPQDEIIEMKLANALARHTMPKEASNEVSAEESSQAKPVKKIFHSSRATPSSSKQNSPKRSREEPQVAIRSRRRSITMTYHCISCNGTNRPSTYLLDTEDLATTLSMVSNQYTDRRYMKITKLTLLMWRYRRMLHKRYPSRCTRAPTWQLLSTARMLLQRGSYCPSTVRLVLRAVI